jgi:hypothetical protein
LAARTGLHVMAAPTEDASETCTGLGGTGVELMLAVVAGSTLQGHPMIPMLQVASSPAVAARLGEDLDLLIDPDPAVAVPALLECIAATLSRNYQPQLAAAGKVRFQLTRGELGVSL